MTPAFVQAGPHDLPDTRASTGRASCQTAGEPTRSIVETLLELELGGRIKSLTVQFARHELIEQLGGIVHGRAPRPPAAPSWPGTAARYRSQSWLACITFILTCPVATGATKTVRHEGHEEKPKDLRGLRDLRGKKLRGLLCG
jgi:hypothetical protein